MNTLIIGAGAAGLATAAELKKAGLDHEHVDRHHGVGGLWDIDNPTRPMYESAHFISSKRLSCFPGRPFDDEVADYPPRTEILRYLREFADAEGIADGIRHGVEVVSVKPAGEGEGGYLVTMREADGETVRRRHSDVVCASGTLSEPNLPDIPGHFAGEYRHSANYRGIDELRGKRVLIIGAGNSGCDIACDAAQTAESAELGLDACRERLGGLAG